ncbi:MAG TPA: hypothetical protein VL017_13175, partial [Devosia sp.]|nr:hypothetical protein [Devosia sp.]
MAPLGLTARQFRSTSRKEIANTQTPHYLIVMALITELTKATKVGGHSEVRRQKASRSRPVE